MIKTKPKEMFILILFVGFINIFALFGYGLEINRILSQSVKKLLSENTDENIDDFQKAIKNRLEYLENVYTQRNINQNENYFVSENRYFYKIDFLKLERIKSQRYYDQLVRDNFFISVINSDQNKNKDINLDRLLIMILKDDGVISGECKISSFDNLFIEQDFAGHVSNYVVDDTGKVIIKNINANAIDLDKNNNIFEAYINMADVKDKAAIDKFISDVKNKKSGFLGYKYNHKKQILNYKPVGINNWYMFSIIPKRLLADYTQSILSSTAKLLLIILGSILGMIIYIVSTENRHMRDIKKARDKLNLIIENVPGGVITRLNDGDFRLNYVSSGFLDLVGYDTDEIRYFFENRYTDFIYSEDIDLVKTNVAKELETSNIFHLEYRLMRKDGQIIWVTERGQLVNNFINSVLIDITRLKKIWDKLKIDSKKYKLIAQEPDSIILEFNISNGHACSSGNFKEFLGIDMPIKDFPDSAIEKNLIYQDDLDILARFVNKLKSGKNFIYEEFRMKNNDGKFIWCRISSKLIFDEKKRPINAVGKIENINSWKLKQEKLKSSAETDLLTGLYNKITTEKLVNKYLSRYGLNKKSAMIAIDLDNFKSINDNFGHLAGDKVLVDVTDELKRVFGQTSIIGRFGGDEFVVFVKDISDCSFVKRKAQEILNNLCSEVNSNSKCGTSCSVGISIYPNHGSSFKELYSNADKALYKAKALGKGLWLIFED